jgi:hypothetical protein
MKMFRRGLMSVMVLAVSLLCGAPTAFASGGSTIASAPIIAPGQQEFGTTADGQYDCGPADFWNLSLESGDAVTIDWEASVIANANQLDVFPAGTTDYSINNVTPLQTFGLGDNGKAQSTFTAGTAGIYPLIFEADGCGSTPAGPFDFIVYVTHAQNVLLSPVTDGVTGVAAVQDHDAAGNPLAAPTVSVTLQISSSGMPWTTIATGAPVAGTASIPYALPASVEGKRVKFRAVSQGSGYQTATSLTQTATIPSPPPACVVPKLLGKRLHAARAALRKAHCAVGRVHYRRTSRRHRGRVLSQSQRAGAHLTNNAKIGLKVGR